MASAMVSAQSEDHYEPVALSSTGIPLYGKSSYIKFYQRVEADSAKKKNRLMPFVFLMVLFLMVTLVVVLSALSYYESTLRNFNKTSEEVYNVTCGEECSINLVESIPANLTFPNSSVTHTLTYDAWKMLIDGAEESIHISSFYWSLRGSDVNFSDPTSWQGEEIYESLRKAGTEGGIEIQVVQNEPSPSMPDWDTRDLSDANALDFRSLNFTRLIGSGILHTKFIIVDRKHFYLGSANMDWRSLTQVKEMGVLVSNCSCMAEDLFKVFKAYWDMGTPNATVPKNWPEEYDTRFNVKDPAELKFNGSPVYTYLSSSPPKFCPSKRTSDIDSILHILKTAESYVDIAVMNYAPAIVFEYPKRYWSVIDDKLRELAYNGPVKVRLLFSLWNHTSPSMIPFLKSLAELDGIGRGSLKVKLFQVPSTKEQAKIPYARVNHNKYMVTENTAYIGTSNWSGDYFVSTAGVGLIITPCSVKGQESEDVREQLQAVFDRDWNSSYAHPLEDFL